MRESSNDLIDVDVLVVEDEYLLASELARELKRTGANVIGPVSNAEKARALLARQRPHVAVLDINLRSSSVFPFADDLAQAQVPFLFATGYDRDWLPERFSEVPCHEKPVSVSDLVRSLARLLGVASAAAR
jgi:two-component SAPR family response regulator